MFALFLVILPVTVKAQGEAMISGKILSTEKEIVDFATVYLKGTNYGGTTNEEGIYHLKAPAGNYTLVVSAIGYKTVEKQVRLINGQRVKQNITITPQVEELDEVVVVSNGISRLKRSAFNAIAVDTKELQNSTKSLSDALAKAPGMKLRESGGVGSDMQLMLDGFSGKHVKVFIDGVPQEGVGSSFALNNIPVNFAERIEVYKGVVPVGFGTDAIGGVVNIVTNKKRRNWFLDASYSFGSFNTHKSYVNFGQTLDNGFTYEINAFQNYSDNDYYVDAPVKDFETGRLDTDKKERVKRFNDTYHNEAIIGKLGFVNRKWADYTNKISDMARIEAGYKGTFQRNASPVDTYTGTTAEDIRQDESLYNRFLYNQDVHALYMTYGGKWNKLSYQAGLRGEYWRVDTRSLDFDQEFNGKASETFEKDYFKLFPSAFISYALPKNNELQVNYTRRLRRPWGGQLNSFRNISDASNISFGNPELTPEYSHSFELNYIKSWESGHTLSLSGYYRSTDDVIQRIRFLNTEDNVMYTTSENVAKSQASGLEIVGKDKLFKILDLTTTVNLYYSKLDGFSYLPQGAETPVIGDTDESFAWNVRMIANLSLPWGVSLQGTGNYNSKQLMAQGHREPNYSVDLGLRKSFLSDKLTLSINARDLLDSRKFRTVTAGDGFWQDSENWRGGRRVGFTLTYNFGNMNKKKDKSKSRSEEPDMFDME